MEVINIDNACINVKKTMVVKKVTAKQLCLQLMHKVGRTMNLSMWSNVK